MNKIQPWMRDAAMKIAIKACLKSPKVEELITDIIARHASILTRLPASLAGHAGFVITSDEWWLYLREKNRGKKLTPTTIKKHIKFMEKLGPEKAILSMEQSMHAGWSGLFEPREDLKKVVRISKPSPKPDSTPPPYLPTIKEIKSLLADPGANARRLRWLANDIPNIGWGLFLPDEKNKLREVMKGTV